MNTRRLFWLFFLAAAVAVAVIPELFFVEPEQELAAAAVADQARHGPLAELRSVEPAGAPDKAQPVPVSLPQADLFAPHSWYVAPVMPTPAAPPSQSRTVVAPLAPQAPPLPFRFIGRLEDQQHLQVFLLKGEQLYTVRVGDVIEDTYRVEQIEQAKMLLTYLPLRISQSLAVGSEP